jgi:hypothetical protein
MKNIKIVLLLLSFTIFTSFAYVQSNVYICNGKYSKKYHYKKDCRGLSNCKSSITNVTLDVAKNKGRTLCGWED